MNKLHMFILAALTVLIAAFGIATAAQAQNRIDLDDLTIKGELLNDNRLRLSNRDQYKISDRVMYRQNFRKEITDGLEIAWPDESAEAGRTPSAASDGGVP